MNENPMCTLEEALAELAEAQQVAAQKLNAYIDALWGTAPSWANWIAMDKSKYWHWYADKPCIRINAGVFDINAFGDRVECVTNMPKNVVARKWKQSLRERPATNDRV